MESLLHDVRFALRTFRRQPAFAFIAILTLALGMGANSAIFTVVSAVVLQPVPFTEPDRLVRITADLRGVGAHDAGMSPPELFDYRDRSGIFESVAGLYPIDANLTEVDEPERVEVLLVSPSYFGLLGVRAALGRVFSEAEEDHPGIAEVVVISDALWNRRFGRAPDVIGRTLRLDDDSYRIVGVMPPEFRHPGRTVRGDVEMWAPAGYRADPFGPPARGAYFLAGSLARLAPGVSLREAQQRLDAFAQQLRAAYPTDYPERAGWTPRLIPLHRDVVGNVRPALLMVMGAVGLVLLIACANIAGLVLARTATRQRELAVRRALGSGRLRIAQLLLTESVCLAVAGGALGLLLAFWGVDLLMSLAPQGIPRTSEVRVGGAVVAFTFGAAVLAGLLFGAGPAVQCSGRDLLFWLKDGRTSAPPVRRGLRALLVVTEFALAMVVLIAASLLVRSFVAVQRVDPGFDASNVLTARVWLPRPNDPARGKYLAHAPRLAFFEDVLRRMHALPGVESAAIVQNLPLDGQRNAFGVTVEGLDPAGTDQVPTVQANFASSEFFTVMRIPLLEGRVFGGEDDIRTAPVAIVNAEMARRFFKGTALGSRVKFGGPASTGPWMTVVGVVGNVRNEQIEGPPRPMLYRPLTQASGLSFAVAVRASGDTKRLNQPLSQGVRAADPDVPVFAVRTMGEVLAAATASRRFAMQLLGGFAALALLLAATGIYGVVSYVVSQRTREIGIRMALGARPFEVLRMIGVYGLALASAGIVIGGLAAFVLGRSLALSSSGLLFEVSASDPVTFAAIAGVLVATGIAATLLPARRAARVDPMEALRTD